MNLELRLLSEAQIHLLHSHQMKRDFPPNELKGVNMILNGVRAGLYDVLGAYEHGQMVGYACVYHPKEGRVHLLDYLAVELGMRGRGYGTALLHTLQKHYAANADALMIECERPKAAPDEKEARKRIRFYTQAGAQLTNVRVWLFEVEYSILVMPCKHELTAQDWAARLMGMYRQMLPPGKFEGNVRLIRS